MQSPFEILGLPPGADETQIRKQYLSLVRRHPPDRDPEKFKEIRAAYDRLCDPIRRWRVELFDLPEIPGDQAYVKMRESLRAQRISREVLFSLAEE